MAKLATFRDDFERTTLGAQWATYNDATKIALSNGRLAITPTTVYPAVRTTTGRDFKGSAVAVEVDATAVSDDHEAYFRLGGPTLPTGSYVYVTADVSEKILKFAGVFTSANAPFQYLFTYDPTAHRWWRMLEVEGRAYFQTSPDGALWTTMASATHGFTDAEMLNTRVELSAGLYGAQITRPPIYFDNLNVLRYGATTERLYARLPELYRAEDLDQDLALKRYASVVVDQASLLERVVDRLPTDLSDPVRADNAWLDWLAQLVGVSLARNLTEGQRRDAVRYSSSGWRAGTRDAVADAARSELTGTKFVEIKDHTTDVSNPGVATQWDVRVQTRATETPNPSAVLAAIVSKNAKPAGIKLYHRTYDASWTTLEAQLTTWTAIEARGTWDNVQETGL